MNLAEIYAELKALATQTAGVNYANWDPVNGVEAEPIPDPVGFDGGSDAVLSRVRSEFSSPIPEDVAEYLSQYIPPVAVSFDDGFEGKFLAGADNIGWKASGYSWNDEESQEIEEWEKSWLFLAEGPQGRAFFVDLNDKRSSTQFVFCWDEGGLYETTVASSIAQFLLLLLTRSIYHAEDRSRQWLEEQIQRIEPDDEDHQTYWMPYEEEDE